MLHIHSSERQSQLRKILNNTNNHREPTDPEMNFFVPEAIMIGKILFSLLKADLTTSDNMPETNPKAQITATYYYGPTNDASYYSDPATDVSYYSDPTTASYFTTQTPINSLFHPFLKGISSPETA